MSSYNGHTEECICVACMNADLDAFILANNGEQALVRINAGMNGVDKVAPIPTRKMKAGQRVGNGTVRTISSAQVNLITRLLSERDTSTLTLLPGQTINPNELRTMGVKGGTALIDKLFALPKKPNTVRMATLNQQDLIRKLNAQLEKDTQITETDITSITFEEVNEQIAFFRRLILGESEDRKRNLTAKKEITEGAYWYGELIARVQRSRQSGRLYVKLQTEKGSDRFEYEPGLIYKLRAEDMLTVQDMKAFAEVYSACADCGKRLTNKMSIERGIGPVCSGKGYSEV